MQTFASFRERNVAVRNLLTPIFGMGKVVVTCGKTPEAAKWVYISVLLLRPDFIDAHSTQCRCDDCRQCIRDAKSKIKVATKNIHFDTFIDSDNDYEGICMMQRFDFQE